MKNFVFFIFIVLFNCYKTNCQLTTTFIKTVANGTCGISTGGPLVQQLSTTLTDTSGLFWADDGVKIAYVERFGPAFGRYTPNNGQFNRLAIDEGNEAIAIFPVKNAVGLKFVIGIDNRLVLSDVISSGNSLKSNFYQLLNVSNDEEESFMKGKTDNKGRLWYSSTHEGHKPEGKLYKIDNLKTPEVMEDNLYGGTGMAWTKDYKYFYLVDSHIGTIYKYDFDSDKGTIKNRRIVFRTTDHDNLGGNPFDLVVDDQGSLWIGILQAGTVIQYDEEKKEILWKIAIPASDIVSLEFGGLDKKTLYIGTTKYFLKKPNRQPEAGALFAISGLGVTGIPDNDIVIPEKYLNLN